MYLYELLKNNVVMREKVHEDSTKAAKTLAKIYCAKLNDNILWICPGQNECQLSVNNFWSCVIGNLHGNWLWPFIYAVLPGFIGTRQSHMLPAPLRK